MVEGSGLMVLGCREERGHATNAGVILHFKNAQHITEEACGGSSPPNGLRPEAV